MTRQKSLNRERERERSRKRREGFCVPQCSFPPFLPFYSAPERLERETTKIERERREPTERRTQKLQEMFEGSVSEQLPQFISSRTSSLPLPLSFPPDATTFSPFDSYNNNSSHLKPAVFQASNLLCKNGGNEEDSSVVSVNLLNQRQRSVDDNEPSWSSDEVLSLLGIRSNMENWFPEFTWEHVSRKLAEMGFKRSPEKCKEKFEEESRYFSDINCCKSYRFLNDLEELYRPENNPQIDHQRNKKPEKPTKCRDQGGEIIEVGQVLKEYSARNEEEEALKMEEIEKMEEFFRSKKRKKEKKEKKFEVLKGFCEDIVKKMMIQQEEMHNKLLEDMVKRDEEKIAKEEAWKREEMEKMNQELEIMAHEQAIAGDRQALIIGFLKQFTENPLENQFLPEKISDKPRTSSSSLVLPQNPKNNQKYSLSNTDQLVQNPSSSHSTDFSKQPASPNHQNPNNAPKNPNSSRKEPDLGKRWPKDEVLALINLRCGLYNNGDDKEAAKAPLWERISQGMMEMGYKRSSKRCKEKWENINKYFRKTRDINKKRSLDSRTCPYFQQLSNLYSHGRPTPAENLSNLTENLLPSSLSVSADSAMHLEDQGERNMASVPAFEFEI